MGHWRNECPTLQEGQNSGGFNQNRGNRGNSRGYTPWRNRSGNSGNFGGNSGHKRSDMVKRRVQLTRKETRRGRVHNLQGSTPFDPTSVYTEEDLDTLDYEENLTETEFESFYNDVSKALEDDAKN
jgi:hypothetical protein